MNLPFLLNKHRAIVNKARKGEIDYLPDNVYDDFYDYYLNNGEMPYGVAKARLGDPYVWVLDKIIEDSSPKMLF